MVKIKIGLFEGIMCCTLLPLFGVFATAFVTIVTLIGETFRDDALYIGLSYLACVVVLIISLGICFLRHLFSHNVLIVNSEKIEYKGREYMVSDIVDCVYYKCKWYLIPFVPFGYKKQQGGDLVINFEEESIIEKIRYYDFKKIKQVLSLIQIK
jgi:hypothetical protein